MRNHLGRKILVPSQGKKMKNGGDRVKVRQRSERGEPAPGPFTNL